MHEIGGSSSIIHMHGELNKARCIMNENHVFEWLEDLNETHKCPKCGSQMRPHIVWFGEMPRCKWMKFIMLAEQSSLFVSIGTSGEFYF